MSERPVLLVVLGTRPEAIKLGTVIPLLRKSAVFRTVVMWTGQHPLNELGKVAELFAIKPDVVLPDGSMDRVEWTLAPEDVPDAVLVQGDTRSTAFGALIAERLGAKLIHLESGLRCWDMTLPEERIRVAVDEQADLLLCPSRAAVLNARTSNLDARVYMVGQTGLDALFQIRDYGRPDDTDARFLAHLLRDSTRGWSVNGVSKALVTVHRAARTEQPWEIWNLVMELEKLDSEMDVIWPVHPRIRKHPDPEYQKILDYATRKGITVCDPIPYELMVHVLDDFSVVITDSGGLVEECAVLGIPCVVIRPNTERIEAVSDGYAVLCPNDAMISNAVFSVIQNVRPEIPFFGGSSSDKVLRHIEEFCEALWNDFLSPPDPKDSPDA